MDRLWWNGGGHQGGMWIWWILGAALIAVVVWAVLRRSRGTRNASSDSPELLLKRRYAEGEFDRETYERMLRDVRK